MRVCLFIGGACDGERRNVDVERSSIMRVPTPLFGSFADDAPMTATAVIESYTRHPFTTGDGRGGHRTDYVYVAHGVNPVDTLIAGYVGRKDRDRLT